MTIYIGPMKDFPYDVNRREGTYFDRDGFQVDPSAMKPHYCVGYEGNDPRLSAWARKQSKGLTNFGTFFEGSTVEEKRLIIWHKLYSRQWNQNDPKGNRPVPRGYYRVDFENLRGHNLRNL